MMDSRLTPAELRLVLGQATLPASTSSDDTRLENPGDDDFQSDEHRYWRESLVSPTVAALESTLPFAYWVPVLLNRWKLETLPMSEDDLDDYEHMAPCLSLALDEKGRSSEFILKIEDDGNADEHPHAAVLLWYSDLLSFGSQSDAAYIRMAEAKLDQALRSIHGGMQDDVSFLHAINRLDDPARRLRAHARDIEQTRNAVEDYRVRMKTTIQPPVVRPYRRDEKRSV